MTFPSPETKQAIKDLYCTREATLIREARIDELKDLQIKGKGNKFTPFEYHYYINNRITELTNQQKGEQ